LHEFDLYLWTRDGVCASIDIVLVVARANDSTSKYAIKIFELKNEDIHLYKV